MGEEVQNEEMQRAVYREKYGTTFDFTANDPAQAVVQLETRFYTGVNLGTRNDLTESSKKKKEEELRKAQQFMPDHPVCELPNSFFKILRILDSEQGTVKCWTDIAQHRNLENWQINIIRNTAKPCKESCFRHLLNDDIFTQCGIFTLRDLQEDLHFIGRNDILKLLVSNGLECMKE